MTPAAHRLRVHGWLREGAQQNATHMLVVFDVFDDAAYPLFLHPSMSAAPLLSALTPGVESLLYCLAYGTTLEPQLEELVGLLCEHKASNAMYLRRDKFPQVVLRSS